MKIKAMDNRFKLKKSGQATHFAELTPEEFVIAMPIMDNVVGKQWQIFETTRVGWDAAGWYYSFGSRKAGIDVKTSQNGIDDWVLVKTINVDYFRIYFRKEEHATFLAMAMQ